MSSLPDLSANPCAVRVVRRPLPVRVQFATEAGICQTLEGPVAYRMGDAVLTGIVGESWPVERDKFDQRYLPVEGTRVGLDGEYVKKTMMVLALQIDAPIEFSMPSGGMLRGGKGDWLLQYGEGDYGIAKDEIFQATYAMSGDELPTNKASMFKSVGCGKGSSK